MKKKIPKKINETEELKNLLQRMSADFENYRKRTQKEKEDLARYGAKELMIKIIPTLDHFDLALRHLPKELNENSWVQGIWHVEKQLKQALSEGGLREIEAVGERFNHEIHEAVMEVESDKPPGEIVEEVQKGYFLGERILRPSKVKVSKQAIKKA